jgi:hypothetical protein
MCAVPLLRSDLQACDESARRARKYLRAGNAHFDVVGIEQVIRSEGESRVTGTGRALLQVCRSESGECPSKCSEEN